VSDYNRELTWLANEGKLNLARWVILEHQNSEQYPLMLNMIVALFKAALFSNDFENIFWLKQKYDITLRKICLRFYDALLENLVKEPHYAEFKIHLVLDFLSDINVPLAKKTIDAFQELVENISSNRRNIWVCNSQFNLVSLLMSNIERKIKVLYPQH